MGKKDIKKNFEEEGSDDEVQDAGEALKNMDIEDEEPLTEEQEKCLATLKQLDEERSVIFKDYTKELNELKAKYQKFYDPLYVKRSEVLQSGGSSSEDSTITGTPALPNFWLKAFKNHTQIRDMIEPQDEAVLGYLRDVSFKWEDDIAQSSFSLLFTFAPNPYFEPLVLVKTYNVEPDDTDHTANSDVLSSTQSTKIEWKEGKDVTKKTVTKKQKNKRTKATRKITETVDCPSFFNFFRSHEIPDEENLEKMNEDQLEELEIIVEADYQAGCIIREKIIPLAVNWFTGEAIDSDAEMSDGEDYLGGEHSDSDEDDEDDEDDSPKKKGQRLGAKGAQQGAGKGEEGKEECKTQ